MICKKCKKKGYFQALSEGTCIRCGKPTLTPHLPSYKVCEKCSMKCGICEQCGKELNK